MTKARPSRLTIQTNRPNLVCRLHHPTPLRQRSRKSSGQHVGPAAPSKLRTLDVARPGVSRLRTDAKSEMKFLFHLLPSLDMATAGWQRAPSNQLSTRGFIVSLTEDKPLGGAQTIQTTRESQVTSNENRGRSKPEI